MNGPDKATNWWLQREAESAEDFRARINTRRARQYAEWLGDLGNMLLRDRPYTGPKILSDADSTDWRTSRKITHSDG